MRNACIFNDKSSEKERYFFEIPIYKCTPDEYELDLEYLEKKIDKELSFLKSEHPRHYNKAKKRRFAEYSYGYDYNEVIDWIKLYAMGDQVRGRYYFEVNLKNKDQTRKRLDKGVRKKHFEDFGKAFDLSIDEDLTSAQIGHFLLKELRRLNREEQPFVKRHINTETLEKISDFVDWRSLITEHNFFN